MVFFRFRGRGGEGRGGGGGARGGERRESVGRGEIAGGEGGGKKGAVPLSVRARPVARHCGASGSPTASSMTPRCAAQVVRSTTARSRARGRRACRDQEERECPLPCSLARPRQTPRGAPLAGPIGRHGHETRAHLPSGWRAGGRTACRWPRGARTGRPSEGRERKRASVSSRARARMIPIPRNVGRSRETYLRCMRAKGDARRRCRGGAQRKRTRATAGRRKSASEPARAPAGERRLERGATLPPPSSSSALAPPIPSLCCCRPIRRSRPSFPSRTPGLRLRGGAQRIPCALAPPDSSKKIPPLMRAAPL